MLSGPTGVLTGRMASWSRSLESLKSSSSPSKLPLTRPRPKAAGMRPKERSPTGVSTSPQARLTSTGAAIGGGGAAVDLGARVAEDVVLQDPHLGADPHVLRDVEGRHELEPHVGAGLGAAPGVVGDGGPREDVLAVRVQAALEAEVVEEDAAQAEGAVELEELELRPLGHRPHELRRGLGGLRLDLHLVPQLLLGLLHGGADGGLHGGIDRREVLLGLLRAGSGGGGEQGREGGEERAARHVEPLGGWASRVHTPRGPGPVKDGRGPRPRPAERHLLGGWPAERLLLEGWGPDEPAHGAGAGAPSSAGRAWTGRSPARGAASSRGVGPRRASRWSGPGGSEPPARGAASSRGAGPRGLCPGAGRAP